METTLTRSPPPVEGEVDDSTPSSYARVLWVNCPLPPANHHTQKPLISLPGTLLANHVLWHDSETSWATSLPNEQLQHIDSLTRHVCRWKQEALRTS